MYKLSTRTRGKSFATVGVVTTPRGRVVATCITERPYGFTDAALKDAEALASERGLSVE